MATDHIATPAEAEAPSVSEKGTLPSEDVVAVGSTPVAQPLDGGLEQGAAPPVGSRKPESLVACATLASGAPNRDACRTGSSPGYVALAIADGVGGRPHTELAAEIAVEKFQAGLKEADPAQVNSAYMYKLYRDTCDALRQRLTEQGFRDDTAASTFIGVVELPDRFVASYIGDGTLYLVRGAGVHGISLLMPHLTRDETLEAAINAKGAAQPAYVEVTKSWRDGQFIVAGTDGAFAAKNQAQTVIQVVNDLLKLARTRRGRVTQLDLDEFVARELTALRKDDDATLGILVTGETLGFWQREFGGSE